MRREGLRLGKDGKKCEDVDECAEGTAKCESGCRNLDPRTTGMPYVCSCPDGLAVDPADQYRCVSEARSHPLQRVGCVISSILERQPACHVCHDLAAPKRAAICLRMPWCPGRRPRRPVPQHRPGGPHALEPISLHTIQRLKPKGDWSYCEDAHPGSDSVIFFACR